MEVNLREFEENLRQLEHYLQQRGGDGPDGLNNFVKYMLDKVYDSHDWWQGNDYDKFLTEFNEDLSRYIYNGLSDRIVNYYCPLLRKKADAIAAAAAINS